MSNFTPQDYFLVVNHSNVFVYDKPKRPALPSVNGAIECLEEYLRGTRRQDIGPDVEAIDKDAVQWAALYDFERIDRSDLPNVPLELAVDFNVISRTVTIPKKLAEEMDHEKVGPSLAYLVSKGYTIKSEPVMKIK